MNEKKGNISMKNRLRKSMVIKTSILAGIYALIIAAPVTSANKVKVINAEEKRMITGTTMTASETTTATTEETTTRTTTSTTTTLSTTETTVTTTEPVVEEETETTAAYDRFEDPYEDTEFTDDTDEFTADTVVCPYTNCELLYSATYYVTDDPLTRDKGVKNFNGNRETWYSERVLPGEDLNIPGRHVADDGTIRDENGYVCVAAAENYMSYGTVLLTSRGPAKVYDCGCAFGTIDIYVNW